MNRILATLSVLLLAVATAGCATTSFATMDYVGEMQDTPDRFLIGSNNGEAVTEPVSGEGCRNPMVDPRDNTRITLIRSGANVGDYQVPENRYGVERGQLLRLDCETGRPLGIVRR